MSGRAALLAVLTVLGACGAPTAPSRTPSAEQLLLTAAELALDCLSGRGAACLKSPAAARGWLAQGQLELLATVPAPILGPRLLSVYDRIETGNEAGQRLAALANEARPTARDLSCKATATTPLGRQLRQRRDELIHMAENLGLAATPLAAIISDLDARAGALDGAILVSARCRQGDLFVLLGPAKDPVSRTSLTGALDDENDADENDARLRAANGPHDWRPVAMATTRRALVRGAPLGPADRAPPIDDPPAPDGVDPWIPVGELDL